MKPNIAELLINAQKRQRASQYAIEEAKLTHGILPVATRGNYAHGGSYTFEYNSWKSMRQRCLNRQNDAYRRYGGRGITVCDRWKTSFENFLADMGPRPTPQHSLDRIDHNGNYEPINCRWATVVEQQTNKRNNVQIIFNGLSRSIRDWSIETKISEKEIRRRIKLKWDAEQILTTQAFR